MTTAASSGGLWDLSEASGFKSRIGRILMSVGRFAVDSAILESLRGFNAGKTKAAKLMQEGMKDRALCFSLNVNNEPGDLKVGANDTHEIMEKRQDELNKVRQEHERSAKSVGAGAMKKMPNEGPKQLDLPGAKEKRVFIRSRL